VETAQVQLPHVQERLGVTQTKNKTRHQRREQCNPNVLEVANIQDALLKKPSYSCKGVISL
jgi:hypothetical protein